MRADKHFSKREVYDSIILTFDTESPESKGSGVDNTKTFLSLGDFKSFSVTGVPHDKNIGNASYRILGAYRAKLNELNSKRNRDVGSLAHHLCGFSRDENNDEFWNKKCNYTMVSLIQFGLDFESFDGSIKKIRDCIENYQKEIKESKNIFDCRIYQSFNTNDIFLFIKMDDINIGKGCAFRMVRTIENIQCYSRVGYENIQELTTINDGATIDKFEICATIDHPETFEAWKNKLKKKFDTIKCRYPRSVTAHWQSILTA